MDLREYFKDEPMGAVNEMAMHLGITATWLSILIHKHKRPSAELAIKIEKATQGLVKREVLRPDLFVL
jgi:DNA-binding transcriptional regulator YdaS (Cro superfamily)